MWGVARSSCVVFMPIMCSGPFVVRQRLTWRTAAWRTCRVIKMASSEHALFSQNGNVTARPSIRVEARAVANAHSCRCDNRDNPKIASFARNSRRLSPRTILRLDNKAASLGCFQCGNPATRQSSHLSVSRKPHSESSQIWRRRSVQVTQYTGSPNPAVRRAGRAASAGLRSRLLLQPAIFINYASAIRHHPSASRQNVTNQRSARAAAAGRRPAVRPSVPSPPSRHPRSARAPTSSCPVRTPRCPVVLPLLKLMSDGRESGGSCPMV